MATRQHPSQWLPWPSSDRSEPALLPYIAVLRVCVVLVLTSVALFGVPPPSFNVAIYVSGIAAYALSAVSGLAALQARQSNAVLAYAGGTIAGDVLGVTLILLGFGSASSDIYLLYGLPLLTAAAQFGGRVGLKTLGAISIAYPLTCRYLLQNSATPGFGGALLFTLPKLVTFLLAIVGWAWLLRIIGVRQKQINGLLASSDDLSRCSEIPDAIDVAARHLQMLARADLMVFATVSRNGGKPLKVQSYPQSEGRPELFKDAFTWYDSIRMSSHRSRLDARDRVFRTRLIVDGRRIAVAATPLAAEGRDLGMIAVARLDGLDFPSALLSGFANQLASAVARIETLEFRMRLLRAISEVGTRIVASAVQLHDSLESLVDHVTNSLGFEYATVSLADEYRATVEMVHGKNVPPGWLKMAKHALDSQDVDAFVIRTGETLVLEGWDDRLDREMYYRYEHESLARVFTPLAAGGRIFGVLQAGTNRRRRSRLLSEANIEGLKRIAAKIGASIHPTMPQMVLEHITEVARDLVDADSASIHVYRDSEPLFVAGAGRATPEFLRQNPPRRPHGLGQQAIELSSPVVISTPAELADANPTLFDLGVKAIAVFPLSLGPSLEGVFYIHFWKEHLFSALELELESIFVTQAEVALQSFFQVRKIGDLSDTIWSFGRLQDVMVGLTSDVRLPEYLDTITQSVLYASEGDSVVLIPYVAEQRRFSAPILKGVFLDLSALTNQIRPASVLWQILDHGRDIICSNVEDEPLLSVGPEGPRSSPFVSREKIKSVLVFALNAGSPTEPVGLLFVNFRRRMVFTDEQILAVRALASAAAVAIRLGRERDRISRTLARHSLNLEGDSARPRDGGGDISSRLFEQVLRTAADVTGSPFGILVSPHGDTREYRVRAVVPESLRPLINRRPSHVEPAIDAAFRSKQPLLIADTRAQKQANAVRPLHPGTRSLLMFPVVDEAGPRCLILLEHHEIAHFSKESAVFVRGLSEQTLLALRVVDQYNELEHRTRPFRALLAIATKIQTARYDLETMLRMALTGVTAGVGLGFSRAAVLLAEDSASRLSGALAVGAQSADEARDIWTSLGAKTSSMQPRDALRFLLEDVEALSDSLRAGGLQEPKFSLRVRAISLPYDHLSGALHAAMNGQATSVPAGIPDQYRQLVAPGERETPYSLACVPVRFRQQTLGVLVADNRFLEREREQVTVSEVQRLEPFADLIASIILNARRWEHAQVEAYQDLAHQLQSPLATACKVLREVTDDPRPPANLALLAGLVAKARRVSTSVRLFGALAAGRALKTNLSPLSPVRILNIIETTIVENEALLDPRRSIRISCDRLSFNILEDLFVSVDLSLLEQAVGNVLDNALKYSYPASEVTIGCCFDGAYFNLFVENDGELLSEEANKCAERYWRGRSAEESAGEGSGLGLWIVNEIMNAHSGALLVSVEPENHVIVKLQFTAKFDSYEADPS
jgi:GAF domain-containing protein